MNNIIYYFKIFVDFKVELFDLGRLSKKESLNLKINLGYINKPLYFIHSFFNERIEFFKKAEII